MNGKSAVRPSPLVPQYSFTSHQIGNPTAPPPGDKLDGEYARAAKVISQLIDWVSVSLNPDGTLKVQEQAAAPGPAAPHAGAFLIAGADPNALALDWAEVAFEWAEHMPGTIPPNILALMGITGDHWSSRWWAYQAARLVQAATPPFQPGMDFGGSGTIPPGVAGDINIRNATAAPVTITLPTGPVAGQVLKFKDAAGNAGTYPITLAPATGTIDGNPTYKLMVDYMAIELYWMGDQWGSR